MTTWLQGVTKGSTKRLTKGAGFTEFGFEQSLPIFWMIQTKPKKLKLPNLVIQISEEPNIWLFDLVIWITKFGNFGYLDIRRKPKKTKENQRKPKKTKENQRKPKKPNLVIIAQNRWGASPKNGISLEGITIFLEKILANPSTAQRE
jgi:hypothetical protein